MKQVVDQSTSQRRFQSFLMLVFAGLALVLASVGIYGVLSSLVVQRTQEIGVRMALGAQRRDVLSLVLDEGFRLVALGLAIGIIGGAALNRFLASLLFGANATNPMTYLKVAVVMIGVAFAACYFPAARATRIRPMVALRYE
jgi:putative ABC transport system permease protein